MNQWIAACIVLVNRKSPWEAVVVLAKVDLLADVGRPLVTIIRMDILLGGRYNQAIRQERKTIEIDPKRPNTYLVLGIVYLKEKQ